MPRGGNNNPYGRAGKPKAYKQATNQDGWNNAFTLAGTKRDRTTKTGFGMSAKLDQETLDSLYASGGIARRIIDLPSQEMTREWFTVTDEKSDELLDRMEELKVQSTVTYAVAMARLFGGSLVMLLADDGRTLSEPLNPLAVKEIDGLRVYDRHQVSWTEQSLYSDPGQRQYGQPEIYTISPINGTPFNVHESRIVRVPGLVVSDRMRARNSGWDYSYLQPVYEALGNLASSYTASASVIQDFVQTIMSIKGLTEMIAGGNESVVAKRIEILDMSRHVLNTILTDADGEQFSKQSSSVAGMSELLNSFMIQVSSITGIPMTKLFGISAGGLNATGDNDIRNFYDEIKTNQEFNLKPVLETIVKWFMLEKKGAYRGVEPAKWSIKFNPLWQMSDRELAEVKKITAETDALYLDRGVFTEAEVAETRGKSEGWKLDIEINNGIENTD